MSRDSRTIEVHDIDKQASNSAKSSQREVIYDKNDFSIENIASKEAILNSRTASGRDMQNYVL